MAFQHLKVKIDGKIVTLPSCWPEDKLNALKSRHPPDGIPDLDNFDFSNYKGPVSKIIYEQSIIQARDLISKGQFENAPIDDIGEAVEPEVDNDSNL